MYEICRFLALKKTNKPRAKTNKPRAKCVRVGSVVEIHGAKCKILRRDEKFKNAWFVEVDGKEYPYSIARNMMKVL